MRNFDTATILAAALALAVPAQLAAQQMPGAGAGAPAAPKAVTPAVPSTGTPPGGSASVPDATVEQVGKALRKVEEIRRSYAERMQAAASKDQQQGLSQQAMTEAQQAVRSQGLSPEQYNQVIREAQGDMALRQRLLVAAGLSQPQQQ